MERNFRDFCIMPLPEDRQGISGAIAGDDSIRAGGGQMLNRRTLAGSLEKTTAENTSDDMLLHISLDSNATSVSQEGNRMMTETTVAGKKRMRMKWTREINIFIIRTYFIVTKLETDMTSYREKLHCKFLERYPDVNVTAQRIADQRRAIIVNNFIPVPILEQIKQEVALCLQRDSEMDNDNAGDNIQHILHDCQEVNSVLDEADRMEEIAVESEEIRNVRDAFYTSITEFTGTDPTKRHVIPRQHTSRKFARIVNILNQSILPREIVNSKSFDDLHTMIYCAAIAAARLNGSKTYSRNEAVRYKCDTPTWQRRLEKRICSIRQDLARLIQYSNGHPTRRLINKVNNIMKRTKQHSIYEQENNKIIEYIDTLKQKLSALTRRLRRYKECTKRKKQNKRFRDNEKGFYRDLISEGENGKNDESEDLQLPTKQEIECFWGSIWANAVEHNENATWIDNEIERVNYVQDMSFQGISLDMLVSVIKKTHNWRAAGSDCIHNYWYKKFTCVHVHLVNYINDFVRYPKNLPDFLTKGLTYLIPKKSVTRDPARYRPITCLQTIYKIITSCISQLILQHTEEHKLLAEEQKGCKYGSKGCKDQLIIDSVIMKQANEKQRNIYSCFIDYRKAFDSVPHSWLLKVLRIYKIHPWIINFLENSMQNWSTTIQLNIDGNMIKTSSVPIRRGIFQGDSLSPIWFCLALNALSGMLSDSKYGFAIRDNKQTLHIVSHLMYMDDVKLYAGTKSQIAQLIKIVELFTHDIRMEFGMDKTRTLSIVRGRLELMDFETEEGDSIEAIGEEETYRYLGFQQARRIEHVRIKQELREEFLRRMNIILRTQLKSKNITKAINTYAIPILTYSFGVITWTQTDLDSLQRLLRTTMTKHHMHHPRSSVERVTLQRDKGGRGFMDIVNLHCKQIASLREYFFMKQEDSELYRAINSVDHNYTPLNLQDTHMNSLICETLVEDKELAWLHKTLHGRHPYDLIKPEVDKYASNAWLRYGDLFPETEAFMIAIQDQVINTLNYKKYIIKDPLVKIDNCRRCGCESETIQHITSGCTILAPVEYKARHDNVAKQMHQQLAMKYNLLLKSMPYYKYKPETVLENELCKMYWDRTIITDKEVQHNRPDITVLDKVNNITYFIDVAVPNTVNIEDTYNTKIQKYAKLAYEIRQQWNMERVVIVPIILSATGVIPKTLRRSLDILGVVDSVYVELQKSVILGTCHIVRKFFSVQ